MSTKRPAVYPTCLTKYSAEQLRSVVQVCEQIVRDGGPRYACYLGLCSIISGRCFVKLHRVIDPSEWEHFSGNDAYPVPATDDALEGASLEWYLLQYATAHSDEIAYAEAAFESVKHKWEGEYGKLRLEYTAWVAEQLRLFLDRVGGSHDY